MSSNKQKSGFSLLELLVAISLLMVITVPILGMFVTSTRIASASYKTTIASLTAQMRVEELVGLTRDELDGKISSGDDVETNYGFWVTVDIDFDYEGFTQLAEATVSVFDTDKASLLSTHTAVIYVDEVT